jgi:isopentenyl-diphosphate delta-isomerase
MHSEAGGSSAPGSAEVLEMAEPSKTEQRKAEHVNIILQENVSAEYNYWNDVRLVHNALPEIDLDDIDLGVKFLGKRLEAPLIISSMTGGFGMGKAINANLAKAAAEVGVAMGVGSQRAALEKPDLVPTYAVVKDHGVPLILANLGAPQLVPQEGKRAYGPADAKKAMEMIDADALIIHLNFLQEVVQPEGDRRAKGCLAAIRSLAGKFPVMAKETGAGISAETAGRLKEAGVRAIDVGGLGGTSFSAVEHYRARKEASTLKERLGATFWNWGIPTPASIILADVGLPLVATGGVRSGLDAAKGIALGATMAGMAKPMLEAAKVSADAVVTELRAVIEELKAAMFLTGSTSIAELQDRPVIVSPPTASWLESREA